jgi:hypothetical protein
MVALEDDLESYLAWEEQQSQPAFFREEVRHACLKRLCDCGHWIDGTEPYRYMVWKDRGTPGILQRTDCEFCARKDNSY